MTGTLTRTHLRRGLPAAFTSVLFATVLVAQQTDHVRRIPLDGAPNFRDLGGYPTVDGRRVRWGQVYRSGDLAQLTDTDYGAVLHRILTSSGPTVYHCTAGKDRTGVFSALLLLMLGVPRDTVFEDYLLTNKYLEAARAAAAASGQKTSTGLPSLMIADRSLPGIGAPNHRPEVRLV